MKTKKYICKALASAFILMSINCGTNSTGDDPKIGVYGTIYPCQPDTSATCVSLTVTNSPSIPSVVINGTEYEYFDNYIYFRFNAWDIDVEPGGKVSIDVYFTSSNQLQSVAGVDIFYPGNFELLTLENSIVDTMRLGEDYFLDWTTSENADGYPVTVQYWYSYYNSANEWFNSHYSLDTIMIESELTLSSSFLYPDLEEVYDFYGGDGRIDIYAATGPMLAGEPGNVEGDGFGIVNGKTTIRRIILLIVE